MKIKFLPLLKLCFAASFLVFGFSSCNGDDDDDISTAPASVPADGKVYVANEHEGTISVIEAASGKVTKTIMINPDNPDLMAHNVQVAPDGKTVWVTGVPMTPRSPEQLIVIDAGADTVKQRINMVPAIHMAHIVFDPASAFAFITGTDAGVVIKVNTSTGQTSKVFNLGSGSEPHGMRYSNGKLYVANMSAKTISVIDVASEQISQIPVGGRAIQTAVSPDGKYVFASLFDTREVVRYNLQTQLLERLVLPAGAQGPIQLYPTPEGKKLYVCDQGSDMGRPVSDKVFVIDMETFKVTQTITGGKGPHGVVVSKDGRHAFVTNSSAGTVSVIGTDTDKVINTIKVGFTPNGISYWYKTGGMP